MVGAGGGDQSQGRRKVLGSRGDVGLKLVSLTGPAWSCFQVAISWVVQCNLS